MTLKQVEAEKSRVALKLATLEADFSLTAFLFSRRLEISRLAVTGLDIDARQVSRGNAGAAAAGAPAVTPGLLASAKLPFDLTLDDVRIEGRAQMAGAANQPDLDARFVITGGKIAPGQEGLLQLEASVNNPAPETGGAEDIQWMKSRAGAIAFLVPAGTRWVLV